MKIRGIYSTALTKFLLDHHFTVISPPKQILRRFGASVNIRFRGLADVQVSDLDNLHGILVCGQPDRSDRVIQALRQGFFDAICRKESNRLSGYAEIEFPYLAKSSLDELRNVLLPTLLHHHRFRMIDPHSLDLVEKKVLITHPERRKALSDWLKMQLIWDTYKEREKIAIDHVKLEGKTISLSEGEVVEVRPKQKTLILRRAQFRGGSTYDGLDIPKMEGDYAITEVEEGAWSYKHSYFRRDGRAIGEYHNINTPVEFYPGRIRYIDLELDVIRWPDGRVKIIDKGELDKQFELGYLGHKLLRVAQSKANDLRMSLGPLE